MYLENATPVSQAESAFLIKNTFHLTTLASNWTIPTSSNGTQYAAQGDVINSAADLTANGAWWVQRSLPFTDIDSTYYTELCFQHNGAGGLRVQVSPRAGFSGGVPNLLRTPSAADSYYLLGGGTDGSPSYTAFLPSPGQRMQGFADESQEISFFLWYPVGGGAATALFWIDRPQPNPKGSGGNLLDAERILFYAQTGSNCALAAGLASESTGPRSIYNLGTANQLFGRCPPQMDYVYDQTATAVKTLPGGIATDNLYGEPTVEESTFRYRRRAVVSGTTLPGESGNVLTVGSKGTSIVFRFGGQTKSQPELLNSVDATTGNTITGGSLAIGDILLPWSGTALLI